MYHHVPPIFYSENCQLSQAIPSSETFSITVRGRSGQHCAVSRDCTPKILLTWDLHPIVRDGKLKKHRKTWFERTHESQSIRIKEGSFAQTFKICGPLSCATGTELLTMSSSARLRCYLNPHEIIFANVYKSIMISRYHIYLDTISMFHLWHISPNMSPQCPHNIGHVHPISKYNQWWTLRSWRAKLQMSHLVSPPVLPSFVGCFLFFWGVVGSDHQSCRQNPLSCSSNVP